MNSSVHVDKKDIIILGERPTQGLDDTALTAEAKYPNNFTQSGKNLYYVYNVKEVTVSCLLKLQKYIKAKNSEIKNCAQRLGNISKDFTINNLKKTELKEVVKNFYCWF